MEREPRAESSRAKGRIELELHDVNQLFNSLDPSPFHDKDLGRNAEQFIVSWAREYPLRQPLSLVIHLERMPAEDPTPLVREAVHNFFAYRARLNRLELRRLLADGRLSLVIGLAFLVVCLTISNLLLTRVAGPWGVVLRESLTIIGWVAMWRPIQIYLHDWWPIRFRARVNDKLSRMPVTVVAKQPGTALRPPRVPGPESPEES